MGNEAAQPERERPWDGVLRREIDVELRSINDDERSFEVVASTETLDSHGDVLRQFWDLSRYEKNGVVLWNHNIALCLGAEAEDTLPIGRAEARVESKKLVAKIWLLKGEAQEEPLVDKIWRRVQQRVINAVSVGFRPGQVTRKVNAAGETEFYELGSKDRPNELREISLVPMGSNPDAVAKSIATERRHLDEELRSVEPAPAPPTLPDPVVQDDPKPSPTGKDKDMAFSKKIVAALSLAEDADDDAVLAAIEQIKTAAPVAVTTAATRVGLEVERIVGAQGSEAIGAVRALKLDQEQLIATRAELNQTKSALSRNAFETAVANGRKDRKLTPHAIKDFQGRFDAALAKGESGDDIVGELQGFIRLAAPFATEARQATPTEGGLLYQGKTYAQMTFSERAKLSESDNELWRQMKSDHEQAH